MSNDAYCQTLIRHQIRPCKHQIGKMCAARHNRRPQKRWWFMIDFPLELNVRRLSMNQSKSIFVHCVLDRCEELHKSSCRFAFAVPRVRFHQTNYPVTSILANVSFACSHRCETQARHTLQRHSVKWEKWLRMVDGASHRKHTHTFARHRIGECPMHLNSI